VIIWWRAKGRHDPSDLGHTHSHINRDRRLKFGRFISRRGSTFGCSECEGKGAVSVSKGTVRVRVK